MHGYKLIYFVELKHNSFSGRWFQATSTVSIPQFNPTYTHCYNLICVLKIQYTFHNTLLEYDASLHSSMNWRGLDILDLDLDFLRMMFK